MKQYAKVELTKNGQLVERWPVEEHLELLVNDRDFTGEVGRSIDWLLRDYNLIERVRDEARAKEIFRFQAKYPEVIAERIAAKARRIKNESFPPVDLLALNNLPDQFRFQLRGIDAESEILQFQLIQAMSDMGFNLDESGHDGEAYALYFKRR